MHTDAAELARRLSSHVEAVCEYYLSNGKKAGRYWLVGDVMNTPGRSLHVRLTGPAYGPGAAGKWVDEADGTFGDLLDLIRINRNISYYPDLREEVLRFLSEPAHLIKPVRDKAPKDSREAARRLFAASKPIAGTVAEDYLRSRGLILPSFNDTLRFHPSCYYRPYPQSELQRWPALIAAITNDDGEISGVLRTFLMRDGSGKAPLEHPHGAHPQGRQVPSLGDDEAAAPQTPRCACALPGLLRSLKAELQLPPIRNGRGEFCTI